MLTEDFNPLNTDFYLNLKIQFQHHRKHKPHFFVKTSCLILFWEVNGVYCENLTYQLSTMWQNAELLKVCVITMGLSFN